jgi:type IV pilus assembly protein PilV
MNHTRKTLQAGTVLFEAMIAVLIFSFGVLGVVGLQARMIANTAEAKYRNEASFFVNRLLGNMWVADRSSSTAMTSYTTSGANYKIWYESIKNANAATGLLGLPGADANPPEVDVTTVTNPVSGLPVSYDVTVTVFWQTPGQPAHRHVVAASITAD